MRVSTPEVIALLQRTLELRGVIVQLPARTIRDSVNSASMLHELLESKCPGARLVQVEPALAERLSLPTLLIDDDGSCLLLVRRRGRYYFAQTAEGGQKRLDRREVRGSAVDFTVLLSDQGGVVRRLIPAARASRSHWQAAMLLTLPCAGLAVLPSIAIGHLVDHTLAAGEGHTLGAVGIGLALVGIQRASLSLLRVRAQRAARTVFEVTAARSAFRELLRRPKRERSLGGVAGAIQQIRAAGGVARALADHGAALLFEGATVLIFASALLVADGALALSLALLSVGVLIVTAFLARRQARLQDEELKATANQQKHLHEVIQGVETFRSNGALSRWVVDWERRMRIDRGAVYRREMNAASCDAVVGGFQALSYLMTFAFVGYGGLRGTMSVGAVVSFFLLSDGFVQAMSNVCIALVPLARARCYVGFLRRLFVEPSERGQPPSSWCEPGLALSLDKVWFRYSAGGDWVLRDFSLQVPLGQHCLLRAPSGTGKSSLLRLLSGYYTPERGEVRLSPGATSARPLLYLPQDATLLEETLIENLRVLSGSSDERIAAAAQATGLDELVAKLPMGYETRVAAGGGGFSGGERQLILLTAVVAADRSIVLLDEPTSNMDRTLRQRLDFAELFKGRTLIVASHEDFGELPPFDRIIDLSGQQRTAGELRLGIGANNETHRLLVQ